MKVFTAAQMRDFDRAAAEEYGIPSVVLMENAALRVVEFLEAKFAPLREKKLVVLCGKGNNGGDGLAIARHLVNIGLPALKVILGPDHAYQGDAGVQHKIWRSLESNEDELGGEYSLHWSSEAQDPEQEMAITSAILDADIVVDALLGTGFQGEVKEPFTSLLHTLHFSGAVHVFVDVPSGLNADSGAMMLHGSDERPRYTLTLAAPKRGLFLQQGLDQSGEVWVGDIGVTAPQMESTQTGVATLDLETVKPWLPARSLDAHKGDAGRALVLGGSFGMSGSIALASRAVLASGVGLCLAAIPETVLPMFASAVLEATSHPLPCDNKGRLIAKAADELPALWEKVQVVALGPGLSRSDEALAFVRRVVKECPQPLVIDADALYALPQFVAEVKARKAPTILTPHPGEMGELMGISAKEVNVNRFEVAANCAQKYGAFTVLKGARTLVATPAGETWVNLSGHPGMATGGSGDVLTGTIAGLLAQLKDAEKATLLGVYLHGYAGQIAARTRGNGLVAGEIAANLPVALEEIASREPERINARLRKLN
jgi:ADP-dependent NAD(P)H-hydrate dehydratase / NAD(P)H-hydrate epimerase